VGSGPAASWMPDQQHLAVAVDPDGIDLPMNV
jgi:hypothetical protein